MPVPDLRLPLVEVNLRFFLSRRDAEVRGGREGRLARAESAPELEVAGAGRRVGNVGIGRLRPTEAG